MEWYQSVGFPQWTLNQILMNNEEDEQCVDE
jgi:hypothetical protein